MTAHDLALMGKRMRERQRLLIKERSAEALQLAKQSERVFDEAVKDVLNRQGSLLPPPSADTAE